MKHDEPSTSLSEAFKAWFQANTITTGGRSAVGGLGQRNDISMVMSGCFMGCPGHE